MTYMCLSVHSLALVLSTLNIECKKIKLYCRVEAFVHVWLLCTRVSCIVLPLPWTTSKQLSTNTSTLNNVPWYEKDGTYGRRCVDERQVFGVGGVWCASGQGPCSAKSDTFLR